MNETIRTHRETALDSPYSRDREDAIEELSRVFPQSSDDGKREILETLREVALDAVSTSERTLAREKLLTCFDDDPERAADVVVPAFCDLAREGKFKADRLDAIDTLRRIARNVPAEQLEAIETTLSELATEATSEPVRKKARRRLTDIEQATPSGGAGDSEDYLAASLAEHLQNAADQGPEACCKRAQELRDYVADQPVEDEAYDEVHRELDALIEQLDVVPTGDELDKERRERVHSIAERIKRLYQRA